MILFPSWFCCNCGPTVTYNFKTCSLTVSKIWPARDDHIWLIFLKCIMLWCNPKYTPKVLKTHFLEWGSRSSSLSAVWYYSSCLLIACQVEWFSSFLNTNWFLAGRYFFVFFVEKFRPLGGVGLTFEGDAPQGRYSFLDTWSGDSGLGRRPSYQPVIFNSAVLKY